MHHWVCDAETKSYITIAIVAYAPVSPHEIWDDVLVLVSASIKRAAIFTGSLFEHVVVYCIMEYTGIGTSRVHTLYPISLAFFSVISYCWLVFCESHFNIGHNSNDCLLAVTPKRIVFKPCCISVAKSLRIRSVFLLQSIYSHFFGAEYASVSMRVYLISISKLAHRNGNKFLAHIKRKISIFYVFGVWIKMRMILMQHIRNHGMFFSTSH